MTLVNNKTKIILNFDKLLFKFQDTEKNLVNFATRQKTHGAPDHTKHPLHGHLHILLNLVVGWCVKVDVEYLQDGRIPGVAWNGLFCFYFDVS